MPSAAAPFPLRSPQSPDAFFKGRFEPLPNCRPRPPALSPPGGTFKEADLTHPSPSWRTSPTTVGSSVRSDVLRFTPTSLSGKASISLQRERLNSNERLTALNDVLRLNSNERSTALNDVLRTLVPDPALTLRTAGRGDVVGPPTLLSPRSQNLPNRDALTGCADLSGIDYIPSTHSNKNNTQSSRIPEPCSADKVPQPVWKLQEAYATRTAPVPVQHVVAAEGPPSPSPGPPLPDGSGDGQATKVREIESERKVVFDAKIFVMYHYPVFAICWALIVFLLWACLTTKEGTDLAGLDSLWPGRTDLCIVDIQTCSDYRVEVWRWWTYQFTHSGPGHITMNSFIVLVFGIPLEAWHGTWRICLMFQLGVVGGALAFMVSDTHGRVVGMSGGCYALVGMNCGSLLMNFNEQRYALVKVLFLFAVGSIDMAQTYFTASAGTSHSAHFGGFVAGLLMCTFIGYNKVVLEWEKKVRVAALFTSGALVLFCVSWGLQWAPMTVFDPVRWCWLRQVISIPDFGDTKIRCVRCDSQACIDKWSQRPHIHTISRQACLNEFGGYHVSER